MTAPMRFTSSMPTMQNINAPQDIFRPRDGDRRAHPIGMLHVPAGSATDQSFQFACDWQDHTWDAQDCVVWLDGHDVWWTLQTTITAEFFGTPRPPIEPRPGTLAQRGYDYSVFKGVLDGDLAIELLPDYGVRMHTVTIQAYGDQPERQHTSARLTWNGTHALEVQHVINRDRSGTTPGSGLGYWDRMHAYDVSVRGEKVGELEVDERRGFNRATHHVAMKDALAKFRDQVFGA